MGRSGSGKTTFLNIAGLLDTFDGGTYHLDGEDVSRLSDHEMSQHPEPRRSGSSSRASTSSPTSTSSTTSTCRCATGACPAAERKERIEQAVELGRPLLAPPPPPLAALGRPAAARRDRARARGRPEAHPRRRADRQPRHDDVARGHGPPREDQRRRGTTIVMVTHTPGVRGARARAQIHLLDGKVVDLEQPAAAEVADRPSRRISPRACTGRKEARHVPPQPPHRLEEPAAQPRRSRRSSSSASRSASRVSTTFAAVRHAFAKRPDPAEERACSATCASTAGTR